MQCLSGHDPCVQPHHMLQLKGVCLHKVDLTGDGRVEQAKEHELSDHKGYFSFKP